MADEEVAPRVHTGNLQRDFEHLREKEKAGQELFDVTAALRSRLMEQLRTVVKKSSACRPRHVEFGS